MRLKRLKLWMVLLTGFAACKKPFQPAATTTNYAYLVVEGLINTGSNAITSITLSRTEPITDGATAIRTQSGATVSIEAFSGASYPLASTGNGVYQSASLNLNPADQYRLRIVLDNHVYLSDFVSPKQSPPIDSVTWKRDKDLTIYVHAHDPLNKTIYYRWDYVETWQYRSLYNDPLGVSNGRIFYRDSTTQVYNCWATANSNDIITASSAALANDVISYTPLTVIPDSTERLAIRYSILVSQYALTQAAYQYWDVLKKSTEQTGTLFDAQPSQISGNIHCISNPSEPVLGYMTAGSVSVKRIYIDNSELNQWVYIDAGNEICVQAIGTQDPNDYLRFVYPDTTFAPYYFITPGQLALYKARCLDCTRKGGVNKKPSFWQ